MIKKLLIMDEMLDFFKFHIVYEKLLE